MLIFRDFLSFVMVVFDVMAEARMVKSKLGFGLVFKDEVESFHSWLKTGNNINIEKSGSNHSTW